VICGSRPIVNAEAGYCISPDTFALEISVNAVFFAGKRLLQLPLRSAASGEMR
jgi:hypothetical protein